jgi:uncharacterized protein YsxB (DUF464 family)
MIRVGLSTTDTQIVAMVITGHAMSARRGQDLVCAGVSSIATGALNALDRITPEACELIMREGEDAKIEIKVNDIKNHDAQTILQTVMTQLETIEKQYPNYITITKQEV